MVVHRDIKSANVLPGWKTGARDRSSARFPMGGGQSWRFWGVVNGKEFKDGMMPKKENKT